MRDDEDSLVKKSQAKDTEAFAELYRRHFGWIYRYIAFQLRGDPEVEDLVAEVFLRAYRAIGGYRSKGVPFSAWLFTIARNCVIDHRRRLRPSVSLEGVRRCLEEPSPSEVVEARATMDELSSALARLTEDQRQVLALKFGAGLSNAEVGRIMGKSDGAVKALQHAGLASLRRKLSRYQEEQ